MPKINKIKIGEWFSFKCEKCDINKKFATEKERLNCHLRHQKFCGIKKVIHTEIKITINE
jgi:hypothetical protein